MTRPAPEPSSFGEDALLLLVVIAILVLLVWAVRCSGEASALPPGPLEETGWSDGACRLYPSGGDGPSQSG